jgi:S1-C subfamily serine protease
MVAHAQESSTTSVAESALPSVVQIFTYDATGSERGQGSGFFVAPCTILTNAHVIAKAYSAAVSSEGLERDTSPILLNPMPVKKKVDSSQQTALRVGAGIARE